MKSTTDINELSFGAPFTWGKIIKIYPIGDRYHVASFHPWKTKGCMVMTGSYDPKETCYHTWVDRKDTSNCHHDLETAIAFCIAYRHEGCNTTAHTHFMRMIGAVKR